MRTNSSDRPSGPRLSTREIVSYGLPRFGAAMMYLAIAIYLPKFYTDVLLLAPAFISWIYLIGRFWDGVTDPIMGYISDGTKSRMGRRRPYFLLSAIPLAAAYFFLWSPPHDLSDWGLFLYLSVAYLLTFTFWTVFSIPYISLGAEMTMDYHERTVLTGVREAFGVVGTLVGTIAPPVFAAIFINERTAYSYLAATTGLMAALLIFVAFFNVRENPEFQKQHPIAIKEGLKLIFDNRPFRTLLVVFVIALIGGYFVPILTLYVGDYVIKVPGVAPYIVVTYLLAVVLSIPFWTRLSRRIGKKEAWSYSLIHLVVVAVISIYYHEGTWLLWFILAACAGFGAAAATALVPSMMADVIDLDELETGRRREGAYFGVVQFVDKAAVGLTAFIGLQTLALMGYKPNVEQPLRVYWAMKSLYSILPAVCYSACYFLLRAYPITQKEHERIRAEIESKKTSPVSTPT